MAELRGRSLIESRYGPLGSGSQTLTVGGKQYTLSELLIQLGLDFGDTRPIDALALPGGSHAVRYLDGQDQRVVAQEFDANFRFLGEIRAHIAEWDGDQAYFSFFSGH